MVMINISREEAAQLYVERSGFSSRPYGREGFVIVVGGCHIDFQDETDAIKLARAILHREGIEIPDPEAAKEAVMFFLERQGR